jgi:hypothetical protein
LMTSAVPVKGKSALWCSIGQMLYYHYEKIKKQGRAYPKNGLQSI